MPLSEALYKPIFKSTERERGEEMKKRSILLPFALLLAVWSPPETLAGASSSCRAWLVQSIPTDMPLLRRVPGVLSSGEVLKWLAGNATERLDIIAQYWQLLAEPRNPNSGDFGYSDADMERFGASEGREVYEALEDAADRKVNMRFPVSACPYLLPVSRAGISATYVGIDYGTARSKRIMQHSGVYPDYANESSNLASGRPNVQNVTLLFDDWWGSGIVHAKVWISDGKDIYIGSANNDWKSLTQVKEVGIFLVGCPGIAKKLEIYFDNLWKLSSLNSTAFTKFVWDEQWQVNRKVPCWSHFINPKERCRSPLPHYVEVRHVDGYPILSNPYMFRIPLETPGYNISGALHHSSYLSFAPPELSFGKFQADEQAWVETIKSVGVRGTVRISTMDWLGQSEYVKQTIYWSSLSSAISEVVFSKNATVKILVAHWAHFIQNTDQYLKSLLYSNVLCTSSKYNNCAGKVEIKYYEVPGYEKTGASIVKGTPTGNIYPAYTRVNHGKYAVSDVRAHIGTSNLVWDYFYTTAGVSFGTYHPAIVAQLQEIFDADWDSPYAIPVKSFSST